MPALVPLEVAARRSAPDAIEPWQRVPGAPFSNYGEPSPHEQEVVRWISANPAVPGNGASWSPLHELDGTVTPNGLHFERHHNGVPQIDPAQHTLIIEGLVSRPLTFSLAALLQYPRVTKMTFIECAGNSNAGWRATPLQAAAGYMHGLASCSEWTGVPVRVLLQEAGVRPEARWVVAAGADAFSMTVSLPVEKVLDDCMVALYQNGERIRPEQGYPLRLLVPGWEGVRNVKWLKSLYLAEGPAMTRNETAKYTELQPDGHARIFAFTMEPKSVITRPSPGMQLGTPGDYEISGLAWSGHGAIERVDVSDDGGRTWSQARLSAPVLSRCFTRFRIPWRWHGQKSVLQSRATDETGRTQPGRAELIRSRGTHGYYHYNAIVSWSVAADGAVAHTYVDAAPAGESSLDGLFIDDK